MLRMSAPHGARRREATGACLGTHTATTSFFWRSDSELHALPNYQTQAGKWLMKWLRWPTQWSLERDARCGLHPCCPAQNCGAPLRRSSNVPMSSQSQRLAKSQSIHQTINPFSELVHLRRLESDLAEQPPECALPLLARQLPSEVPHHSGRTADKHLAQPAEEWVGHELWLCARLKSWWWWLVVLVVVHARERSPTCNEPRATICMNAIGNSNNHAMRLP